MDIVTISVPMFSSPVAQVLIGAIVLLAAVRAVVRLIDTLPLT